MKRARVTEREKMRSQKSAVWLIPAKCREVSRVVTFRRINRRRRRYNARGVIAPRSSYPARDNRPRSFRRRFVPYNARVIIGAASSCSVVSVGVYCLGMCVSVLSL